MYIDQTMISVEEGTEVAPHVPVDSFWNPEGNGPVISISGNACPVGHSRSTPNLDSDPNDAAGLVKEVVNLHQEDEAARYPPSVRHLYKEHSVDITAGLALPHILHPHGADIGVTEEDEATIMSTEHGVGLLHPVGEPRARVVRCTHHDDNYIYFLGLEIADAAGGTHPIQRLVPSKSSTSC